MIALGLALGLGLAVLPQGHQVEAKTKYVKFDNCKALNKVYKGGVAKDKKSQQYSSGRHKAYVNKKLYLMNEKRDRDKDRVACER